MRRDSIFPIGNKSKFDQINHDHKIKRYIKTFK